MSGVDSTGRISPSSPSSNAVASSSRPFPTVYPGFLPTTDEPEYTSHTSPTSSKSSDSPSRLPYLHDSPTSLSNSLGGRDPQSPAPSGSSTARPIPSVGSNDRHSPFPRRQASPLHGVERHSAGLNEELGIQRESSTDEAGMLSRRMDQLSLPRQSDHSGLQSSEASSSGYQTPHEPLHSSQTISVPEVLGLLQTSPQLLILDTRPLGVFLESHLPRSANISIPSLIFKRFKKSSQAKMTTWDTLAGFVSTPAGKAVWDDVELTSGVDIVVVGLTAADELAKTSRGIMEGLVEKGSVRILHGGWAAVLGSPAAIGELVSGELSETTASDPTAPPKSAPPDNPALSIPSEPPSRVSRRPSLPSLHVDADTYKRKLPSLSIQGNSNSRRPPKLSLNLDKPMRSATLPPEPLRLGNKSSMLSINVGQPNGLASGLPKTPLGSSFQTLCHAQSKLPPSPSSFGDVKRVMEPDEDIIAQSPTARPEGLRPGSAFRGDSLPSAGLLTSRNSMTPFIVSTVLPSFLFLGPEITSQDDIDVLKSLGVKRILNVAVECDDDEGLMLRDEFERYFRVPMRDTVEESGVAKGMKDACELLDDARLHSAPTYVHCKAGKSRSVTVVLAYLIHANAWTLKTSYAYVAERRKGISPNIGFVAELMQFEEAELGLKQSGGVHGKGTGRGEEDEDKAPKGNSRHVRESLPPTWASNSLDSGPPKISPPGHDVIESEIPDARGRQRMGDEREVRKNGYYMHHRRAPVDRTTLQPGRRVSKAGLESFRSLTSTLPTPGPGTGEADKSASTPGVEGRLGWV